MNNIMSEFNNGNPYHGSGAVAGGKLQGATDTDYFYFFCPKCPNRYIMRILDYEVRHERPDNPYNEQFQLKAKRGFVLAFKLHCEKCGHTDFVKISNVGWQGGTHDEVLRRNALDPVGTPPPC
jgi:predicted nucleic-acid-binding Zn-ribbon protein